MDIVGLLGLEDAEYSLNGSIVVEVVVSFGLLFIRIFEL
jgi:hypothetical protein